MVKQVPFFVDPQHREALLTRGLASLEDCLAFDDGEVVKSAVVGRETLRFDAGGHGYYMKRIRGAGCIDIQVEARALERLSKVHVPAPRAVAMGVEGGSGALITEALPARRTLESMLLDGALPEARLRRFASRLANMVSRLHAAGVNHRDLYVGHVLVDASDELYLVDLGRAEIRDRVPRRRVVKDLAALHFSVPERIVGNAMRMAFLRRYLGTRESRKEMERWMRAIERKAHRMAEHVRNKIDRGDVNVHINE